jgi:hypothetical protein
MDIWGCGGDIALLRRRRTRIAQYNSVANAIIIQYLDWVLLNEWVEGNGMEIKSFLLMAAKNNTFQLHNKRIMGTDF